MLTKNAKKTSIDYYRILYSSENKGTRGIYINMHGAKIIVVKK